MTARGLDLGLTWLEPASVIWLAESFLSQWFQLVLVQEIKLRKLFSYTGSYKNIITLKHTRASSHKINPQLLTRQSTSENCRWTQRKKIVRITFVGGWHSTIKAGSLPAAWRTCLWQRQIGMFLTSIHLDCLMMCTHTHWPKSNCVSKLLMDVRAASSTMRDVPDKS